MSSETAFAIDARRVLAGLAAVTETRRRERKLSQEALSRHCGFGRHYIGAIERADASLDIRGVAQLAHGLGYGGLLDLLIHAAIAAARLDAAGGRASEGGGSNGRSR